MSKTITLSDEQLNRFKKTLNEASNASVDEMCGDAVHICEYFSSDEIIEIAKAIGVYDENEMDKYGEPLWRKEE